jgi:hypothetical protein
LLDGKIQLYMKYQFTKFSIINALWSLIPIFPTWTIFPGILMATGVEHIIHDCEFSYQIVLWISIVLAVLTGIIYLNGLEKTLKKNEKDIKLNFRVWSLVIYTLVNTAGLILFIGTYLACEGDGQTVLAVIFTGPISSLTLVIYGLIIDVKINFKV